jgi:hypothetical protein
MTAVPRNGPLARFAALAGGRPVLMMTAQFGRSHVRQAAYGLRAQHRDLDLKPSWQIFTSRVDWGTRWPAEQDVFAGGLILSAAGKPVVERAVGRCLADLARLDRPLLWGAVGQGIDIGQGIVIGQRIRWQPRFALTPNGRPLGWLTPYTPEYARLRVARDTAEFSPRFDPNLYSTEPDFFICISRLWWWGEADHFYYETCDGGPVTDIWDVTDDEPA